jgi:hypothetical protein
MGSKYLEYIISIIRIMNNNQTILYKIGINWQKSNWNRFFLSRHKQIIELNQVVNIQ